MVTRSPKVMINTSYVFLLSGYRKMVTDRDDDPFGWWRTLKDQSKDKSNQLFGSQVVRDLEKYGTVHKFASDSEFSKQKSNVRAEKMARWLDGALHSHRLITSGSPRMGNLQCRDLDSNYFFLKGYLNNCLKTSLRANSKTCLESCYRVFHENGKRPRLSGCRTLRN